MSPKKKKTGQKTLLITALMIIIFWFLILEIYLRLTSEESFYKNDIYHVPRPYIEFSGKPNFESCEEKNTAMGHEGESCLKFNELGLRGDLPAMPKAENEYRILVFGGSTIFNGEPLENSIPQKIEYYLKNKGYKNVTVYNWGVISYNSAQALMLFLNYGLDYDPDMVVFYQGANELQSFAYDPRPNYPYNFYSHEMAIENLRRYSAGKEDIPTSKLAMLLLKRSKVIEKLFGKTITGINLDENTLREKSGYLTEKWKQEIKESYIKNINKASLITQASGIELVVFHQPIIYFKNKLHKEEEPQAILAPEYINLLETTYTEMGKELEALSLKYPFIYKDIKYLFKNNPNKYFWDLVHTNNDGNDVIAKAIAETIAGKIP